MIKKIFFGTYRTLLQVFSVALTFRQKCEAAKQVAKRKGMSAKNWWSLHRGSQFRGYRLARAVGRGTYSELSPQQAVNFYRKAGLPTNRAHLHNVPGMVLL